MPDPKRGTDSEVALNQEDGMKGPCAGELHNAVTISRDRLGRRVATWVPREWTSSARHCASLSVAISVHPSAEPRLKGAWPSDCNFRLWTAVSWRRMTPKELTLTPKEVRWHP